MPDAFGLAIRPRLPPPKNAVPLGPSRGPLCGAGGGGPAGADAPSGPWSGRQRDRRAATFFSLPGPFTFAPCRPDGAEGPFARGTPPSRSLHSPTGAGFGVAPQQAPYFY